jgi:hypothetical protein
MHGVVIDVPETVINDQRPESRTPTLVATPAWAVTWGVAKKIAFRWFATYFFVYIFPWPLGNTIPFTGKVAELWGNVSRAVVLWVNDVVLNRPAITVFPNGSGDTTYNYIELLTFATIATIVTLVWSVVDRRRPNYDRLHDWVWTYVRFYTGAVVFSYGMAKVIQTQFPYMSLERMLSTYGNSSPMGLLWTFMGFSYGYNIFAGIGECAAVLMFFRRTATLGALITIGVMGNVAILNYTFDVPVKLFSTTLLAMAFFVLAPQAKRVLNALVLNRATPPAKLGSLFTSPRLSLAARVMAFVFLAYITYAEAKQSVYFHGMSANVSKAPLYGIYEVETFVRNQDTVPPLLTDTTRWKRVIVVSENMLAIHSMRDTSRRYAIKQMDTVGRTFNLESFVRRMPTRVTPTDKPPPVDSSKILHVSFSKPDAEHLLLTAVQGKGPDRIQALLRKVDHTKFLINSRGYHWVNEFPLNR